MTVIGLTLIAVGVIALLTRFDVISGAMWGYVWPVILIILGLWFFLRWRWQRHWWCSWYPRQKKRDRSTTDD